MLPGMKSRHEFSVPVVTNLDSERLLSPQILHSLVACEYCDAVYHHVVLADGERPFAHVAVALFMPIAAAVTGVSYPWF
jgi:hypothetical protein